jgi:hypothetical protein
MPSVGTKQLSTYLLCIRSLLTTMIPRLTDIVTKTLQVRQHLHSRASAAVRRHILHFPCGHDMRLDGIQAWKGPDQLQDCKVHPPVFAFRWVTASQPMVQGQRVETYRLFGSFSDKSVQIQLRLSKTLKLHSKHGIDLQLPPLLSILSYDTCHTVVRSGDAGDTPVQLMEANACKSLGGL